MNDRVVLDICSGADPYVIDVAANDRAEPDARVFTDLDVTYDHRVVSDKRCRMNKRRVVVEWNSHGISLCVLCELSVPFGFRL